MDTDTLAERGLVGWRHSRGWLFGTMLASALISLYASFILTLDALELAKNPAATFSCDINSVISCGTVAASWQAELLGFPNSLFGLMCEPVVITVAVAGLAGVRFPRWFMATAQGVYFIGLLFAYWLFQQSFTEIGALCPYCLLITFGTTMVFFTLLHYNIMAKNLYLPPKVQEKADMLVRLGVTSAVAILMLITITVLIVAKYGQYFF